MREWGAWWGDRTKDVDDKRRCITGPACGINRDVLLCFAPQSLAPSPPCAAPRSTPGRYGTALPWRPLRNVLVQLLVHQPRKSRLLAAPRIRERAGCVANAGVKVQRPLL